MENLQDVVPEVMSNATISVEQDLLCNVKSFEKKRKISHLQTNIPDRLKHFIIQQMHKYINRRYN